MKPEINFFCVGAQKAGTTTLHDILIQHPDVYLPASKEAHFFDEDEKYNKGIDWYLKTFFPEYNGEKICGSCNPEYMYFEEVPKRMYETFGTKLKLVFILRNPANRAYSHYLMSKRRCFEDKSFEEAIKLEKERIDIDYFNKTHFSYLTRGYYAEQIERYLKYFPKNNMYFVRFEEDFLKNRNETIENLFNFLELDPLRIDINLKSNPAKTARFKWMQQFIYKPNILKSTLSEYFSPALKQNIRKYLLKVAMKKNNQALDTKTYRNLMATYSDEIKKLERMIKLDLSSWK